jgi:hypothetical protein
LSEAASGAGLNPGGYGAILARSEIPHGSYPVTLSYLQLVSNLVVVGEELIVHQAIVFQPEI